MQITKLSQRYTQMNQKKQKTEEKIQIPVLSGNGIKLTATKPPMPVIAGADRTSNFFSDRKQRMSSATGSRQSSLTTASASSKSNRTRLPSIQVEESKVNSGSKCNQSFDGCRNSTKLAVQERPAWGSSQAKKLALPKTPKNKPLTLPVSP